ncbi:MAG: hypothetical protein R3316_08515 [Rhodovibrionaceae bacterium]|nr:hypothetical protein [Rhodovibrionaceae bacterium]
MSTREAASLLNGAVAELLVAAERLPNEANMLRSYAAQIQLIASEAAARAQDAEAPAD